MHRTQRAWRKAQELGGKDALNCIAELNSAALEEAHYQGRRTAPQQEHKQDIFADPCEG